MERGWLIRALLGGVTAGRTCHMYRVVQMAGATPFICKAARSDPYHPSSPIRSTCHSCAADAARDGLACAIVDHLIRSGHVDAAAAVAEETGAAFPVLRVDADLAARMARAGMTTSPRLGSGSGGALAAATAGPASGPSPPRTEGAEAGGSATGPRRHQQPRRQAQAQDHAQARPRPQQQQQQFLQLADLFRDIYATARQLRQGNTLAALVWARSNGRKLRAEGCGGLEFQLHALHFSELLRGRLHLAAHAVGTAAADGAAGQDATGDGLSSHGHEHDTGSAGVKANGAAAGGAGPPEASTTHLTAAAIASAVDSVFGSRDSPGAARVGTADGMSGGGSSGSGGGRSKVRCRRLGWTRTPRRCAVSLNPG
jgi:hypothetical protein